MDSERNEISVHEVKIYLALAQRADRWCTAKDLHAALKDVAIRTVRAHMQKFVSLGLVDQAEIFPGHRYRLSARADQRNKAYVQRLKQAADILGLK